MSGFSSGQLPVAPSPCIEVGAGLVFRNGRLLITQRRAHDHLGGFWEFPGGKREPNETFSQCIQRELREELGIEVRVGELLLDLKHAYPERTVRLCFHRCSLEQGEPRPLGVAALAWVTREQLEDYEFPAADARLLGLLRTSTVLW
jgi:mutator protein MutT